LKIVLSNNAKKHLKSLDKKLSARIAEAISKIPEGDIKALKNYESAYRLRVGDYRILFCRNLDLIKIDDILPRGSAYKK